MFSEAFTYVVINKLQTHFQTLWIMLLFYANQVFSGELEAKELECLYECFKKKNKVTLITTVQSYCTYLYSLPLIKEITGM